MYFLVTGASTGIGRATALLLERNGFRVFAGARRETDAQSLRDAASENLVPIILDVTNSEQIAAAAKLVTETVGSEGLAGLVNNAGVAAAAPLEFVPVDDFRHQLEVNVVGQLAVTQALLPLIRAAGGRIVNITSIGGLIAGPMLGPYHASKFALEALTDTLRVELKPWGVHVIAVEPGEIATPIWATSSATSDRMMAGVLDEVTALYGPSIARAQQTAKTAAERGLDPIKVAEVVERALTTKRPRTRYPVGTDAKLGSAIVAGLPDRLRDRLLASR